VFQLSSVQFARKSQIKAVQFARINQIKSLSSPYGVKRSFGKIEFRVENKSPFNYIMN